MLSRHNRKAGVVIETILILAGLALLAKAGMTGTSTYRFIHACQRVEGSIAGIGNHGFTLDIQFSLTQDQDFAFAQDTLPFDYHVGDQVQILYDQQNPSRAMMANFTAVWFDTIAFALGGFILAGIGFHLRAARSI